MFATTNTRRDPTALVSDKRSLHEHELNKRSYFKVEEVSKEQTRKNEHRCYCSVQHGVKKKKRGNMDVLAFSKSDLALLPPKKKNLLFQSLPKVKMPLMGFFIFVLVIM